MTDTRDTTKVNLMFCRRQGDTYIDIDGAVATLRAVLPLTPAIVALIDSIELEWRRAAEKAFSR